MDEESKTLAKAILVILSFQMVRHTVEKVDLYKDADMYFPLVLKPRDAATVLSVGMYCLSLVYLFRLTDCLFYVGIVFMGCLFSPHLSKTSKYYKIVRSPGILPRDWSDRLVTTSLVYFVSFVLGVWYGFYKFAFLCLITTVGSSIYHRHRESKYFNLDNVFASSLMVFFVHSLVSSYTHNETYFLLGMLGLPVAVFLLVYCGMPSDVIPMSTDKSTDKLSQTSYFCCLRTDRPLYNFVHVLWHLASGVGPIISMWYFNSLQVRGITDPYINILPELGVLCGVLVNLCGCSAGVMPLD